MSETFDLVVRGGEVFTPSGLARAEPMGAGGEGDHRAAAEQRESTLCVRARGFFV